jgi:hypothetical protein
LHLDTGGSKISVVEWEDWARRIEQVQDPDGMVALFAAGGTYCDPLTPTTTDVRAVAVQTFRVFPDWQQRLVRIRGGDDWAFFEWTGVGTYRGPGAEEGPGFPVSLEGCTAVEVDADGLVTRYRDYPDVYASIQQVTDGLHKAGVTPPEAGEIISNWDANFADEPQVGG